MRRPNRSVAWYTDRALSEAGRTASATERRKHLNIAWRSRIADTQKTAPLIIGSLIQSYKEGAQLLDDSVFEATARQLAQVADTLNTLKRTRGNNRLFALIDTSESVPQFTLRHIRSFDEAYKANHQDALPYSPFGAELTDTHVVVRVSRTQEITSLGEAGLDDNPTKVQIARVALPWALRSGETANSPESWVGTVLVGRRAIDEWVATEHGDWFTDAFAERIRALREDAWPVVTYTERKWRSNPSK